MRHRNRFLFPLILTLTLVLTLPATWATPFTVTVDISSIIGLEFELDFQLFNNDGIVGNSSLLVDNVFIRDAGGVIAPPGRIDFESGGLEGFEPLSPDDPVSVVAGGFIGGSFLLRLGETNGITPTITLRPFPSSTATHLQFDFELVTTSSVDSVVALILNPNDSFAPFPTIAGLLGFGDVLEATSAGNTLASGVTASPVPEPSSLLLMALVGVALFVQRRRQLR